MSRGEVGREGFALLAVLWVVVAVAAIGMMAQLAARESVSSAHNRADLTKAAWLAEGCVERARAAVSAALRRANLEGPDAESWTRMRRSIAESPLAAGCEVSARAAGSALDVNNADADALHRFFAALGTPPESADSLTDALLDWRDPDPDQRPAGAEAGVYLREGRSPPRNGPLAAAAEARRVRGFGRFPGLDTLMGVESGKVPLTEAPLPVLAALPGFGAELLARVADLRMRGEPVPGVIGLTGSLSEAARVEVQRHASELADLTTAVPDAWVVTARARVGTPAVVAVVEVRLVRAGNRAAVVRRRSWTE